MNSSRFIEYITPQSTPMSWFAVTCIVLTLWKYDRFLLDKLQRWMWTKAHNAGWALLKTYAYYKDKNEMIKDGYHVDSVFLYEHQSSTYYRKIDVLRIFRRAIVEEKFTYKKDIDIKTFLELCSDPESNFQYNPEYTYQLEVDYTFDKQQYKIIYSTDENNRIRFPIYSETCISKANTSNSIISANLMKDDSEIDGEDISDIISKYAGPLANLYADTDYVVKRDWVNLFSNIDPNCNIVIMDLYGNDFVFNHTDTYLSIEKH